MPPPLDFAHLLDDRPDEGVFRIHRDAFCRQDLFEQEQKILFEQGWVFLGHASQLPRPHDFRTTRLGRHAVVIMRDAQGSLAAFLNSCRHKGAQVCQHLRGNSRVHVCQYHGWSYDSAGRNVAVKAKSDGAYAAAFDQESHGLLPLTAFESYRGFLFGSIRDPGCTLDTHLGDVHQLLDLVIDQSPEGIEFVPGEVSYRFRANWKLQIENTIDAYHFATTHASYLGVMGKRAQRGGEQAVASLWQGTQGVHLEDWMGAWGFTSGHATVWTTSPPERHPLFAQWDSLRQRVGEERAKWMLRTRQLNVFPNLQIGSSAAIQLRVIRPLAPDLTEIQSYCIAPVGEPAEMRAQRIRQYEDFYNPSGLATPDDTVNYEDCQRGMQAGTTAWLQGHARGLTRVATGADQHAHELGITPQTSVEGSFNFADESVFRGIYRHWLRKLQEQG
jgi:benzoate/toluate 1,2-dioxygenase subunit alpha